MVLGVTNKTRTRPSIQTEYLFHVQYIKPWPPTQSLKNIRSVFIECKNGERDSRFTSSVAPSLEDGKIEFNESFRLTVTLLRNMSVKNDGADIFHKNLLEFSLYESCRDTTLKGQLLGTAIVDMAEYGIIRRMINVSVPVNIIRRSGNPEQPILHLKIRAYDRVRSGSNVSLKGRLVKEMLLDKNDDVDSVSVDEADVGSFIGDDVSSHSSASHNGVSTFHDKEGKTNNIADALSDTSKLYSELNLEKVSYTSGQAQESIRHFVGDEKYIVGNASSNKLSSTATEKKTGDRSNTSYNSKIHSLKILERELRETAALEVALYSVVAEHGSSTNKVHTPARRLSRFYLRARIGMERASAAQSALSGLIVVAKACGNDVPRLTFWLSNCVVLRAIVNEAFAEEQLPLSASSSTERKDGKGANPQSSARKWMVYSSDKKANRSSMKGSSHNEDLYAFMSALVKVESWIFSRIVESVWWQTLIPHMQSSSGQMIDKVVGPGIQKKYRRSSSSIGQEQVNLSLELWRKAFKDAFERLCPLRAAGHECGCLPVLAKLVMEQCVVRLDVAMFNAILRESADDIPTDPISDPISDAKVLPVPAGKTSFGSGAQLKNAIGNWSRWLTDLFGMDDDDSYDDKRDDYEDDVSKGLKRDSTFKSFYLLKSLSDLMMLPKDMLVNETIRREVCPAFGTQFIKRVLNMFVRDEFCSDRIPDAVFQALDAETTNAENEGLITHCPSITPPVLYSPPPPSSMDILLGVTLRTNSCQLQRSGSILRRSNTSDDELDELGSPFHAILCQDLEALPRVKPDRKLVQNCLKNVVRYKLLREVWDD